jgi:hypothetical protein
MKNNSAHSRVKWAAVGWALALAFAFLAPLFARAESTNLMDVSCVVCEFTPQEGWSASGPGGNSWDGHEWNFDFSQGTEAVSLSPADRTMLLRPEQFRLRVSGSAKGHPIRVFFRTHFMTFHKVIGALDGGGEQELKFDAPPGPGWEWQGGENDGKIHGPLRLAEIRLEANGLKDQGRLTMISLSSLGKVPANRLCAMTADMVAQPKDRTFQVQIQSLARENLYGELKWTFRDWNNNVLEAGSKPVILPILGAKTTLEIKSDALKGKRQFAEAEFELRAENQQACQALAYWLKPPPTKGSAQLRPESPFGMGVYLCRYGLEEMEVVAQRAQEAGVKWSREDFGWGNIETQPGHFEWNYTDRLLDCARRHGITIYPIVAYWPGWAKAYTTEGIDQYVSFLRALATRYHGQIKHWEIWNEPNIFFWQGTKEQYAELLTKSYRALKDIDPDCQVLGLSTSQIDYEYIEWMLKHQTPFDILTIHPYRTHFDDSAFIADLKKVSDLARMPDGKRRPVWLTEMGWATHATHPFYRQDFAANSQRTQAELIARVYLSSIVSGVEPRTFWYDFRNDGDDPYYFEHNMGILRQDNQPKAAYLAYRTMTSLLDGLRYEGPVDAGVGNLAFRFVEPGHNQRSLIAVWNPKQAATVELKVTVKRVKLTNTVGETTELETVALPGEKKLRLARVKLNAGAVLYVE